MTSADDDPECPLCGEAMKWEPYVTEETVLDGYRCFCYEGGWRFA